MNEQERQERDWQWEQENAIAEINRRITNQMFQPAIDFVDEDEEAEEA